ncbi:MAG: alpha/beta fold hydrolase [Kiloniellales bacterium]|nr:alpha/beta fold hydrolase [Kiloniellales bacterium]
MESLKQRVRFAHSPDGIALAWASSGQGVPMVKAANWLTHLEYDLESPVWSHWVRFFSDHFHLIRYDERGCGLSDRSARDFSFARWVEDLETVVAAAEVERPILLLGISQGASAAIAYAVKHPDKVSGLILHGGYARGWRKRGNPQGAKLYKSIVEILDLGWNLENPVFRQLFTSRFIPDGSDEQIGWYNDLCHRTMSSATASRLLDARADVDVFDLLPRVSVPTLVVQSDQDQITPMSEARILARHMPKAELVVLESRNHILLKQETAWSRFKEAVLDFAGGTPGVDPQLGPDLKCLSPREREILSLICEAKSNPEIAAALAISERTVRNHATNIFRKLGIKSRAEAIVYLYKGREA